MAKQSTLPKNAKGAKPAFPPKAPPKSAKGMPAKAKGAKKGC